MDILQAIGTMLSFTAFGLMGALVMKAFQIGSDVSEMKDLLRDIRRNGEDYSPAAYRDASKKAQEVLLREMSESEYLAAVQGQPEALARAVEAERILEPEVVPPPMQGAR